MKIGSLFSGAGALDMAVEQVFGTSTVWHCEYDAAASKVLAAHWDIPNHRDITTVDWDTVEPVDIMCGGYPCQPFSSAGQRKGHNDERHLWPYFAEAIRRIGPQYVILENVAGHRSMGFDSVLADLAAMRFDADWCSLRASDIGAPHGRDRIFVVAYPQHGTRDGERPRPESGQGDQASADPHGGRQQVGAQRGNQPERPELEASQRGDVGGRGDLGALEHDLHGPSVTTGPTEFGSLGCVRQPGSLELFPTPAAARSGRNQSPSPGAAVRPSLDMIDTLLSTPQARDYKGVPGDGFNTANLCRDISLLQTPSVAGALGGHLTRSGARADEPLLPGQAKAMNGQQWGKYAAAIRRWENATRPAPSPTEPNKNGNPRLSAAFSEWLMGWPAGWVTDVPGISRNDQLRIIGNGVVPQQAVAALRWLLSISEVAA